MRRFVTEVIALCAKDKRAQADLRSGLGLPYERCHRLHRHLVRLVPEEVQHPAGRRPYYAVAALIAARSRSAREQEDARAEESAVNAARESAEAAALGEATAVPVQGSAGREDAGRDRRERVNLGASLAEAVNAGVMKPDSAESELHYMARVGSESLNSRLPALLRQFTGRGVFLDWAVLLDDLSWWDRRQDHIATRWLESYFRVRTAEQRRTPDGPAAPGPAHEGDGPVRGHHHNDTTEENE
ncbi:type I-E CRISPR-associated protein Cse2/CasB [Streptomyces sp. NPDC058279]|uniref:type I-E CRISPR-associated protein Cse2/CasB n=1 Tax=Streptomyces sp. NPDC058279 TaxID=3346418 RepID=UPI0036EDBB62